MSALPTRVFRARLRLLAAACAACLVAPLAAQETQPVQVAAVDEPVRLEAVVVKGQLLRGADGPFSTTSFDQDDIRAQRIAQTQELFRFVPGMNVRAFGLSGVADSFTLRGFNSGGHGGDVGVVIDGIPLNEAMSHADGYADFNVVIPLEIASMTVFRGPVSALYGNFNRAGLIALETRKGGTYGNADLSLGSDTTADVQAALGTGLAGGSQALNLAAQVFHTDGFRPDSAFTRGTFAGRWAIDATPQVQASVAARVHRGRGDSATYLTRAQFEVDPYGKDPRAQNDGSEKDFATLRGDLAWQIAPQLKALTFVYGTQQDFTRWFSRPIGATTWAQREESYDRDVSGAGANLNGQVPATAGWLNWVAGVETFRESTAYQFYDLLDQRRRTGPALYDRTADLNSVSLFGEVRAPLHALFQPWLGVRWDRFTGGCVRNGPETGAAACDAMSSVSHTSPKIGVRTDVAEAVQLRASWAEGFALPSDFDKYSSGAARLDPNVFRQTEIGALLRLADVLRADLALFRIDSSSEFRAIAPGIYENSGETRRQGAEASLTWTALADLDFALVVGSADTEITANANPALVGKEVAGVPEYTATLSATYAPLQGWGGNATVRRVGSYAVNATNTVVSDAYTTLDLTLTYASTAALRYRTYLGIDNATDRAYYTSNTVIAGTQMLAPAAPRTFKVGVQFDF